MSFLSGLIGGDSLHLGSSGDDVKRLQTLLNQKVSPSPGLNVDGLFGPATAKAVIQFQASNGLATDSIVGPKTKAKLGF